MGKTKLSRGFQPGSCGISQQCNEGMAGIHQLFDHPHCWVPKVINLDNLVSQHLTSIACFEHTTYWDIITGISCKRESVIRSADRSTQVCLETKIWFPKLLFRKKLSQFNQPQIGILGGLSYFWDKGRIKARTTTTSPSKHPSTKLQISKASATRESGFARLTSLRRHSP